MKTNKILNEILILSILLAINTLTVSAQIIFEDGFEDGILKTEWTARPSLDGINGVAEIKSTGELAGIEHTGSLDASGNVYVADLNNHMVRKITIE